MTSFFDAALGQYGYLAVAAIVMLEGFGIPLPGETIVVAAAAFAARGVLDVAGVVAAASVGTVLGGTGGYWIGRAGGRRALLRFGRYVRVDAARLARAEGYFARHGLATVFLARFVALLRIFGAVLAGVARMPFLAFSLVNLAGGILWSAIFAALGFAFGENLPRLEHSLGLTSALVAGLLVLTLAVWAVRARARARNPQGDSRW